MREQDLLSIKIPKAWVEMASDGEAIEGTVVFKLELENDAWYLCGEMEAQDIQALKHRVLLESEDIADILDDALSIDQWAQDAGFKQAYHQVCETLCREAGARVFQDLEKLDVSIKPGEYVLQQHAVSASQGNLLDLLGRMIRKEARQRPAPDYLKVDAPDGFIPDRAVLESLRQHIYEGTPAIAILGPTGSGKSALARYAGHHLNNYGYGIHIIDAHVRLEGDRLFERDDFNAEGTFIQEGVLLRLARETRKIGLRLIVVLEEYNAFSDETRREFYRLFNDEDRRYPIQSTKDGKIKERVDFSHVQFILTGNPLSSEKYLTDDLKRLSNAEARRLTILYLDYTQNPATLREIFQAIIHRKQSYQSLSRVVPDVEKQINYQMGVDIFRALNTRGEGKSLGFDVGYSDIANCLWTLCLRGHRPDACAVAITEHILNAIPDITIRSVAADRIRQAANIKIPTELLVRDI